MIGTFDWNKNGSLFVYAAEEKEKTAPHKFNYVDDFGERLEGVKTVRLFVYSVLTKCVTPLKCCDEYESCVPINVRLDLVF